MTSSSSSSRIANTTFLHFNDVYNIEKAPCFITSLTNVRNAKLQSKLPVGKTDEGNNTSSSPICRVVRRHHSKVITLFSGDAFSPSMMSTVLKGKQMIPVLNACNIDVACLGNHDLDFGLLEFESLRNQCNFPWICSNAYDATTNEPLGGCYEYIILNNDDATAVVVDENEEEEEEQQQQEQSGPKILVIGLIEKDWLDTLSSVDPSTIIFEAPTDYFERRVSEIKTLHGPFDAIVAISHMRVPQDKSFAVDVGGGLDGVDIIFGGHDHHYEDIVINNVRILNSGTDFRSFTILDVVDRDVNTGIIQTTTQKIDVCQTTETPDAEVVASIQRYSEIFNLGMNKVVGVTNVPLDARFSEIRTKESNVGNFICELMTRATGADIALINAGTFRADRFLGQDDGVLTEKDLCALLPIADDCMVVELTAERLLLALENGVSRYPAKEGRFLQCDGVRFAFDPNQPAGSRVVPDSVYVRNRPRYTRRRSLTRAESMEMPAMKDELEHLDELQQPQDKLEDCDIPPGFSPLDYSRTYSVFSTGYVIAGKDGFDKAFLGAPVLICDDRCPHIPLTFRSIFTELRTLSKWQGTSARACVMNASLKLKSCIGKDTEVDPWAIHPKVDGRIKIIDGLGTATTTAATA